MKQSHQIHVLNETFRYHIISRKVNGKTYQYLESTLHIGKDRHTGKERIKTIRAGNEEELAERITKELTAVQYGYHLPILNKTMKEFLEEWFPLYETGLDESTRRKNYYIVFHRLIPYFGPVLMQELSEYQIQDYVQEMLRQGLKPKSIRCHISILSQALNYATEKKQIRYNPATLVRIPRGEKPVRTVLNGIQISSLLSACGEDVQLRRMIEFLLYTGLRINECLGLTWNKIDFEKNIIRVDQQLSRKFEHGESTVYLKPYTKFYSSRTLHLPSEAFDILKAIKEEQEASGIYSDDGYVFAHSNGSHLNYNTVLRKFKHAAVSIGLPELRIHDLRRTCASVLLEVTNQPMQVQKLLGHAYLFTTLDYCESTEEMNREDCERLGEKLRILTENAIK